MEAQCSSYSLAVKDYLECTIPFFWNSRATQFYYSVLGCNNWLLNIQREKEAGSGQKLTKSTIFGLCAGFGGLKLLVAPSISTGDLSPFGTPALIGSSIALVSTM